MVSVKKTTSAAPVPHYAMADGSEPPYLKIVEEVSGHHLCSVGSSYFYVQAEGDECRLCRIVYGGGRIFFHEQVDHEKHGITGEELEESLRQEAEFSNLPGYYFIAPRVSAKLHVLYD